MGRPAPASGDPATHFDLYQVTLKSVRLGAASAIPACTQGNIMLVSQWNRGGTSRPLCARVTNAVELGVMMAKLSAKPFCNHLRWYIIDVFPVPGSLCKKSTGCRSTLLESVCCLKKPRRLGSRVRSRMAASRVVRKVPTAMPNLGSSSISATAISRSTAIKHHNTCLDSDLGHSFGWHSSLSTFSATC